MSEPEVPEKIDRQYFRSLTSGDRGVLLTDGKTVRVTLTPGRYKDLKYDERTWRPDGDERHPLIPYHVARICHAADAALAACTHDYARVGPGWEGMRAKQRTAWERVGPTEDPIRKSLWEAIQAWGKGVTSGGD